METVGIEIATISDGRLVIIINVHEDIETLEKKKKKRKEKIVVKLEFNLTGTEIEMESLFISGFKGILEDKNGRWTESSKRNADTAIFVFHPWIVGDIQGGYSTLFDVSPINRSPFRSIHSTRYCGEIRRVHGPK